MNGLEMALLYLFGFLVALWVVAALFFQEAHKTVEGKTYVRTWRFGCWRELHSQQDHSEEDK